MKTRVLGQTGIEVSRLCLGTVMLGYSGNPDHKDCARIIHRAIDGGINFIDSSDSYNGGESEEIIGKAIKNQNRDHLVINSKFSMMVGDDRNEQGGSRKWLVRAVEKSLKRLGTDYIDLYQIHRLDEFTDMEETMWTLTELVRQGKIRHFGSSMFSSDRIVETHWLAEKRNLLKFRCEQPKYSLFTRDVERYVLPACHHYGMGAITWGSLESGMLSGKYKKPEDITTGSRVAQYAIRALGGFNPESEAIRTKLDLIDKLSLLASDLGLSLPQLATAFTLEHPYATASIIGPRTLQQLESLLPAVDVKLDSATLDAIDTLLPPGSNVDRVAGFREIPDNLKFRRSNAVICYERKPFVSSSKPKTESDGHPINP